MIKDYNYFLQDNAYDCGVACLKTIFLMHGKKISKEDIIKGKINQGISALKLINASKKLGLNAKGIQGVVNDLKQEYLPCIAHVVKEKSFFHYIVLIKNNLEKEELLIFDPSVGVMTITYAEFKKISTNVYLVFDNKKFVKEKDKRFSKILKEIFKSQKSIILKSLLLSIFIIALTLIYNYYLRTILIVNNDINIVLILSLFFLIICLIKNIFEYFRNKIIIKLNKNIDQEIKNEFFNHLINLPNSYYYDKNIGELVVVTNDIENFKNIVSKIFVLALVDSLLLLAILCFVSIYNILYLIVFLILLGFIILISLKYRIVFNNKYLKLKNSKIKESSFLIEILNGINSIKNLGIEDNTIKKLKEYNKKYLSDEYEYSTKNNKYSFTFNSVIEVLYIITIMLSMIISINNKTNIFDIVLFSSIYTLFISFLSNVAETITMSKTYYSSIIKVLDILDLKKEKMISEDLNFNKIIFKNINFSYKKEEILKKINFDINKKDKIFIYGKSGEGKSTLIKLLLKNILNYKGNISIDNNNIKIYKRREIKKVVTYVSQDEMLFNDSILNNLKIVNENIKEIEKVKEVCLINEFLNKNKINDNYILEENATNISGGERKKILIARGLLKNSKILILDESLNEIDIASSEKILKNISENYPKLTIILISHRKSNMELFNKCYELKNGVFIKRKEKCA